MERNNALAEKIVNRLEQHRHNLAEQQQQLDDKMKVMLQERERLAAIAKRNIETVILPRMEELARHFDNAKTEVLYTVANFSCACQFTHTARFPATVRLDIALLPGDNESLTARNDLTILPVLMEYNRNVEERFSLEGNEEALAGWVEDRILDFIDTYLRLEANPFYQKNNTVTDIVCGMSITITSATSFVKRYGRIYYFCSEHCKESFLRENG